ncbi:MAG: hypothetical protein J6N73_09025 [Prevotella sp.]|nr:hypothetical protein [Prevotella sp.]
MKQNNLLKTLLLLTLLGGVSSSWAEGTINIPQTVGSYIPIGTVPTSGDKTTATGVTLTGCSVDGNAKSEEYTSYTVGSTNGSTVTIQFDLTATAGNYLFSFKSGHKEGTSVISLSLKNSSDVVVWNNDNTNVNISNTGAWSLTEAHTFLLGDLEAGNYTLTINGVSKSDGTSYYGNFGNFCFLTETSAAMPYSTDNTLQPQMATTSGLSISGTYLTSCGKDSYADNIYFYVSNAAYYSVFAGYGYATAGTDQFTITITDMATGTAEVNAQNYTLTSLQTYLMPSKISAGWKKLRLDHPITPASGSYRLEKMYFTAIQTLPLMTSSSTTYLDLSKGTYEGGDIKYESGGPNIGYVKDGQYVDFYVENETPSYYTLQANIPWYQGAGKFTVTINDVATTTEEATATSASITATSDATVAISNKIMAGLKSMRISFAKDEGTSTTFLFNLKNITFYQRSLNENYDYSPVAASNVDVELVRTITAGNWSTICLPFAMTNAQLTTAFGSGVKVAELSSGTAETLTFSTVTETVANKPYAIKVASNFTSATISGVTIASATPTQSITNWDFVGTYTAGIIPSGSYFFNSNQLLRSTDVSNTIKPFRGYFTYTGGANTAKLAKSVPFVLDNGETTAIGTINADGQMETKADGVFYNLAGQRVANPRKGLYIVNGKKVILK